jgi:hypothetical protein
MIRLVYVAGPYRAGTRWDEEQNCRRAESAAREIVGLGLYPVCPHANTRPYFSNPAIPAAFWLGATLELMRRCDAVLLLPGWAGSEGAVAEREEAERLGIPVFCDLAGLAGWRGERDAGAEPRRPTSRQDATVTLKVAPGGARS